MKKNMGSIDRVVRIILAITLVLLYYFEVITGTWAIAGIVLAVVLAGTSFISTCPLYMPFGISTNKSGPEA